MIASHLHSLSTAWAIEEPSKHTDGEYGSDEARLAGAGMVKGVFKARGHKHGGQDANIIAV